MTNVDFICIVSPVASQIWSGLQFSALRDRLDFSLVILFEESPLVSHRSCASVRSRVVSMFLRGKGVVLINLLECFIVRQNVSQIREVAKSRCSAMRIIHWIIFMEFEWTIWRIVDCVDISKICIFL